MKSVVITGANGFIGDALTKKLLKQGVKVIGIGNDSDALNKYKSYGEFTPIKAEFTEYEDLDKIIDCEEVDVFYHLAWAGGFTTAIKDYKLQMSNAGYTGDAVVLANKINAKRFVYANTYNQYEILNFLESETFEPRYTCIYSTGKTAGSLISRTLAYNMGMEYVGALIPMPYGENNYSKQLVNVVISSLINGVAPKLVEGNNYYDLVYIEDIADAFIAIGENGHNMKEYYVGHRKLCTFKELMENVRDCIAPEVPLVFGEYKDNQQIDYSKVNLESLFEDTGFECKADFSETIKKTADWIRENNIFS